MSERCKDEACNSSNRSDAEHLQTLEKRYCGVGLGGFLRLATQDLYFISQSALHSRPHSFFERHWSFRVSHVSRKVAEADCGAASKIAEATMSIVKIR
jgi:hypothetical protein